MAFDPRDRECVMTKFGPMRKTIAGRLGIRADDGEPFDRDETAPPLVADSAKKTKKATEADLVAKITDSLAKLEKRFDALEAREKVEADARRKKRAADAALARAEADAEEGQPFAGLKSLGLAAKLARDFESSGHTPVPARLQ